MDRGARFGPEADFGEETEDVSDRLLYSYRHELRPSIAQCTPPVGTVALPCLLVGHGAHTQAVQPRGAAKNMAAEEEGGGDSRR